MIRARTASILSLATALLLSACGRSVYYVSPREWKTPAQRDSVIRYFSPYLEGRKIFLDPGHGGVDRSGRGPEGEAVEADVNLRVALALRSFLTAAGARVFLSRDRDTSVELTDRVPMALSMGAELFISLHHNATGTADDITNYSSVYYHSREGRPDYHPSNHDIARYIERDMSYAMRNAAPPFSSTFDGTLSDFDIYPNSGFAVLRENPLPAVLVEASFFSHPYEEQRLSEEEFNRIEAWGIFAGLGKYFRAGVPQVSLLSDSLVRTGTPVLQVGLSPWTAIDRGSLSVRIDGAPAEGLFSDSLQSVCVSASAPLTSGYHLIEALVRNTAGNWNWPFRYRVNVMLPAAAITATARPAELAPDERAVSRITVLIQDSAGMPVADGMTTRLTGGAGAIDSTAYTSGGSVIFYVDAPGTPQTLDLLASADSAVTQISIPVRASGKTYFGGIICSAEDRSPLAGASVGLADSTGTPFGKDRDTTCADGRFCLLDSMRTGVMLMVRRSGYETRLVPADTESIQLLGDIALIPIAAGRLHGRTICLDPRYGGLETGDSDAAGTEAADVNLEIANRLGDLLREAGANVSQTRTTDSTISEAERARISAGLPRGLFLRIDASQSPTGASCEIFGNRPNRLAARALLEGLSMVTGLDTTGTSASPERFYRDVAMGTVTVRLPSPSTGYFLPNRDLAIDRCVWGLFIGLLIREGLQPDPTRGYRVVDSGGTPMPGTSVILDHTLSQRVHPDGTIRFWGLEHSGSTVRGAGRTDLKFIPLQQEIAP